MPESDKMVLLEEAVGEIADRLLGIGRIESMTRHSPALAVFAARHREQRELKTSGRTATRHNYCAVTNATVDERQRGAD
jgi:hypothetical protein